MKQGESQESLSGANYPAELSTEGGLDVAAIEAAELEQIARYEVKPIRDEESAIVKPMEAVVRITRSYNDSPVSVSREKIHLLSPGGAYQITEGENRSAFCNKLTRQIGIDRSATSTAIGVKTAHEMFHLLGGLKAKMEGPRDIEMAPLGEGIVCELESRAYRILKEDGLFSNEAALTDRIRPWTKKLIGPARKDANAEKILSDNLYVIPAVDAADILEIIEGPEPDDYKLGYLYGSLRRLLEDDQLALRGRIRERENFARTIAAIFDDNPRRFNGQRDVLENLITAYLTKDDNFLQGIVLTPSQGETHILARKGWLPTEGLPSG